MRDLFRKAEVLFRDAGKKVADKHSMGGAGFGAGGKDARNGKQQHAALLRGNGVHEGERARLCSIGFGKKLARANVREDARVAPKVVLQDVHFPRKQQAGKGDGVSLTADQRALWEDALYRLEAVQHAGRFFRGYAAEQRAFCNSVIFHHKSLVCWNNNIIIGASIV